MKRRVQVGTRLAPRTAFRKALMENDLDLGFARVRLPPGTHVCQIFSETHERDDALLRFVSRGLQLGETTACFSDSLTTAAVEAWLEQEGLSPSAERGAGRFTCSPAASVYFEGGRFDPERTLSFLAAFLEGSERAGRPARIIGEMPGQIDRLPGGSRLLEYEAKVNAVLRAHPVNVVCQYDARAFSGETIMDVLTVHPQMVVRGAVVHNPFFVATGDHVPP